MDLSGLFSVSGLIQLVALGALLWVIQNSYGSQLQQQARAAAAVPSAAPLGLNTPLQSVQQQSKKNKKKKGGQADGDSQAAAADSKAAQEVSSV